MLLLAPDNQHRPCFWRSVSLNDTVHAQHTHTHARQRFSLLSVMCLWHNRVCVHVRVHVIAYVSCFNFLLQFVSQSANACLTTYCCHLFVCSCFVHFSLFFSDHCCDPVSSQATSPTLHSGKLVHAYTFTQVCITSLFCERLRMCGYVIDEASCWSLRAPCHFIQHRSLTPDRVETVPCECVFCCFPFCVIHTAHYPHSDARHAHTHARTHRQHKQTRTHASTSLGW